jgi:hypothetical protein
VNLFRDFGYGLRQIVRLPAFSLAIILTLAIGIGPDVAIFSVLKALLLEPLPYFEPHKLVRVWQTWIPLRVPEWGEERNNHWLLAVARLKPHVSWRTAEVEIRWRDSGVR